jgi:hypothetical protein
MRKVNLKENDLVSIIKKVLNEQEKTTYTTTDPSKVAGCGHNQFPCGGGCCNTGGTYHTTCVGGVCRDYSVSRPTK